MARPPGPKRSRFFSLASDYALASSQVTYQPTGRVGRVVSTDGLSRFLDEKDLWAEEVARRVEVRGTRAGIEMGDDEPEAFPDDPDPAGALP